MSSILNNAALRERLIREGLLEVEDCTSQENVRFQGMLEAREPLPDGIYRTEESAYEFQRVVGGMPSPEEERNLLMVLQTRDLKKIRDWVTYFGVISILSIIVGILTWLANS